MMNTRWVQIVWPTYVSVGPGKVSGNERDARSTNKPTMDEAQVTAYPAAEQAQQHNRCALPSRRAAECRLQARATKDAQKFPPPHASPHPQPPPR